MNHLWPLSSTWSPCGAACGDVGAHVGAALALGHAHAERDAGLLPPRQRPLVVVARQDLGLPFREHIGLRLERADAGMGHGDRAEMAALGLGREIEPHGAAGQRSGRLAAVVRGTMDAPADALRHQRVIGGMELDEVDAVALAVHRAELGRVLVRDPPEIERLGRAVIPAAGGKRLQVEPVAHRRLGERLIGTEQIDIAERRRLIERGVLEETGAHRRSLLPSAGQAIAYERLPTPCSRQGCPGKSWRLASISHSHGVR